MSERHGAWRFFDSADGLNETCHPTGNRLDGEFTSHPETRTASEHLRESRTSFSGKDMLQDIALAPVLADRAIPPDRNERQPARKGKFRNCKLLTVARHPFRASRHRWSCAQPGRVCGQANILGTNSPFQVQAAEGILRAKAGLRCAAVTRPGGRLLYDFEFSQLEATQYE